MVRRPESAEARMWEAMAAVAERACAAAVARGDAEEARMWRRRVEAYMAYAAEAAREGVAGDEP